MHLEAAPMRRAAWPLALASALSIAICGLSLAQGAQVQAACIADQWPLSTSACSSKLPCCGGLPCTTPPGTTKGTYCVGCKGSMCLLPSGEGVCCESTLTTCVPGFGCCPNNAVCEVDGKLVCCKTGQTCSFIPQGFNSTQACTDCPPERACRTTTSTGEVVERCCPEGQVCKEGTCVPTSTCPQPCNDPSDPDRCCNEGLVCAANPFNPSQDKCCPETQLCFSPWSPNRPKCCPLKTTCNSHGECVPCPTGTNWCADTGTCCRKDEACLGTCCPKPRVCGSPQEPICCPPNTLCDGSRCKPIDPPCDAPNVPCWYGFGQFTCCPENSACLQNLKEPCCDKRIVCKDYPTLQQDVCCKDGTCLNLLWPSPGSVSADLACCPQDKICNFQDSSGTIYKQPLCCATACTTGSDGVTPVCCPDDQYNQQIGKCCPIGSVPVDDDCKPIDPLPCPPDAPIMCPLANGTLDCCREASLCLGGDAGCCASASQVCPDWPAATPEAPAKCCNTTCLPAVSPSVALPAPEPSPIDVCCPADRTCAVMDPTTGSVSTSKFCCNTMCSPINITVVKNPNTDPTTASVAALGPGTGGTGVPVDPIGSVVTVNICCPKEQLCGRTCCAQGFACVGGKCCPSKSICTDPATGERICCLEGRCALDWATGQAVCCGQPGVGGTICVAPSWPPKSFCCPRTHACMLSGECCLRTSYCFNPATGQDSCCAEGGACVGGSCCPLANQCFNAATGNSTCCDGPGMCFNGVCCPKERKCVNPKTGVATCCPDGQPCIDGRCCNAATTDPTKPPPSVVCPNPSNFTDLDCCSTAFCLPLFPPPSTGPQQVCCPSPRACMPAPFLGLGNAIVCCSKPCTVVNKKKICCPWKVQTVNGVSACCPLDTRPMPDGKCCPSASYCVGTSTGKASCCVTGQVCTATALTPEGNNVGTCCEQASICRNYANPGSAANVCCASPSICTPMGLPLLGQPTLNVCCPAKKRCMVGPDTWQCCAADAKCALVRDGTKLVRRCVSSTPPTPTPAPVPTP